MVPDAGAPKGTRVSGAKPFRHRFESEVHLGILGIIFLLLFLNFSSNYLIFSARAGRQRVVVSHLDKASAAIAQRLTGPGVSDLTGEAQTELMSAFQLQSLIVLPSAPVDESPEARRLWFSAVAGEYPPVQLPALAGRLLESDFGDLDRGEAAEYFTVRMVGSGTGPRVVVLSRREPELARLDDICRLALIMAVIALSATAAVYVLLSKLIFAPFRKVQEEARMAGRTVDRAEGDVEALLEDYRRIIGELRVKESELINLNAVISQHADSLEQFNRYLLESMRSGVITVDGGGKVRAINAAASRILGCTEASAVGRPYTEVIPAKSELARALESTLRGSAGGGYREAFLGEGQRRLTIGIVASAVADQSGAIIGAALVMHDITEVTRLREELEVRNRLAALGEMSGGLAHQLRNSMGAIGGYLALLKRRLARRGIEEAAVGELTDEAAQAETLVRRFLEFARPFQADMHEAALDELLTEAVESFRMRAEYAGARIVVENIPAAAVKVDRLLFKQALTNLLENAVQAGIALSGGRESAPGAITVEGSRHEEAVQICVTDQGCGIAAENLQKIFTPFYSSRPSGTGLGLPLVLKIVELHGGHIEVRSQPGMGATFTITLPIHAPAETVQPAASGV